MKTKTRLAHFEIEQSDWLSHATAMKTTTKRRAESEAEVLEHATRNMLKALKQDMVRKEGRINHEKLRKDGYSERLITRLDLLPFGLRGVILPWPNWKAKV